MYNFKSTDLKINQESSLLHNEYIKKYQTIKCFNKMLQTLKSFRFGRFFLGGGEGGIGLYQYSYKNFTGSQGMISCVASLVYTHLTFHIGIHIFVTSSRGSMKIQGLG